MMTNCFLLTISVIDQMLSYKGTWRWTSEFSCWSFSELLLHGHVAQVCLQARGGERSGIELRYVLAWDLTSLTNTLAFHCLSKSSMQQIAWGQTVEYYDGVDASVVRAQFGNLPHSGTHSHHPLALSLSVDGCPPNWKVGVCVWMCLLRNPIAKIYRDSCIINWII